MSKASDAGKSFLTGVLAKLPESRRAQVEALLLDAEAEKALEVIGTGALAQPDINKKYTELQSAQEALDAKAAEIAEKESKVQETYQKQSDWWTANEPKVKGYDTLQAENTRLKAGGNGNGGGAMDEKTLADLRKEMDEKIGKLSLEGTNVMAFMTTLGVKHFKEFGEEPDMQSLLGDKKLGTALPDGRTYGLIQAYEAKYGEQIKARATKAEEDRINKLVEEKFSERMKGVRQPFPLRTEESVLDILDSKQDSPDKHTEDSATALYEQLTAARG